MKMKRDKWIVILAVIIAVLAYVTVSVREYSSNLSEVITTSAAIAAAGGLAYEFRRDKRLNEAQFLLSLNDQFIGNKEMTKVEQALECYNYAFLETGKAPKLGLELDIDDDDRQRLINYLVHLEGIATIVRKGVIDLETMEDLLAYRFFIAVNNPVVQEKELYRYPEYYRGIFELHEKWTDRWIKENRVIPLSGTSLKHDR